MSDEVERSSLELTGAEFREQVLAALRKLGPWLDDLPRQPAARLDGSRRLARRYREPLPERPSTLRRLLSEVIDRAVPVSLNTASPGYLGFIPGGGLPQSALADLIAGVTNRYTGLWMPAPGLVQMEMSVLRWLCDLAGYGAESGGLLTSGGSIANLCAVVAARDRAAEPGRAVMYASSVAHHSMRKAAHIAGFTPDRIRTLPADAGFRLSPAAVARAVAEDRAAGLCPAMVVASAGTTAVGSVDDLPALADLCAEEDLWLHTDAAYGGAFLLTVRGQAALDGIARSDSVTLDPHKGLFVPYGTGCVLVRDRSTLRRSFTERSAYLPEPQDGEERWDFADLGPELSRPFRGLRLWLPLKLHGAGAFRQALDEKLDLARDAHGRIAALPDVRTVTAPALSLFTFRVEPPGAAPGLNRRIIARVNQRRRVFLTGATVDDQFVIRVCVLSFRTHQAQIDHLVEDLAEAIADPRG